MFVFLTPCSAAGGAWRDRPAQTLLKIFIDTQFESFSAVWILQSFIF